MKTIYLDSDFMCHLTNGGTVQAVETDFFDGRCDAFIEGYRFVPAGQSWTRSDGVVFTGEMVAPAEDYSRLEKVQLQYELDEAKRLENLGISQEHDFTATRNYPIGSFLAIYGNIYEVMRAIPLSSSINSSNSVLTTVKHYLDTLKEEQ